MVRCLWHLFAGKNRNQEVFRHWIFIALNPLTWWCVSVGLRQFSASLITKRISSWRNHFSVWVGQKNIRVRPPVLIQTSSNIHVTLQKNIIERFMLLKLKSSSYLVDKSIWTVSTLPDFFPLSISKPCSSACPGDAVLPVSLGVNYLEENLQFSKSWCLSDIQ